MQAIKSKRKVDFKYLQGGANIFSRVRQKFRGKHNLMNTSNLEYICIIFSEKSIEIEACFGEKKIG